VVSSTMLQPPLPLLQRSTAINCQQQPAFPHYRFAADQIERTAPRFLNPKSYVRKDITEIDCQAFVVSIESPRDTCPKVDTTWEFVRRPWDKVGGTGN